MRRWMDGCTSFFKKKLHSKHEGKSKETLFFSFLKCVCVCVCLDLFFDVWRFSPTGDVLLKSCEMGNGAVKQVKLNFCAWPTKNGA